MDEGMDYDVHTKVNFLLNFDSSGEFNALLLPDIQKKFAQHVKEVFEHDEMGEYISSDLNFHFDGRTVRLEYTFHCFDENEAEAESFSAYCVRGVRKELEAFGCKVGKIRCKAEEADMTWLDRLEDAVFGPREAAPVPDKTKSSQKKRSHGKER